jgi:hypothetical protein
MRKKKYVSPEICAIAMKDDLCKLVILSAGNHEGITDGTGGNHEGFTDGTGGNHEGFTDGTGGNTEGFGSSDDYSGGWN